MKGCAFSGHRFIKHTHTMRLRALLGRAVRYAYGEGCRDFFSGGAMGFDLLAAEVVLDMKRELPDIRLVMLLPCIDQDKKWPDRDRAYYERIVNSADEVICLTPAYYNGCMQARNRELVRRADILIAYLERDSGGTAQTVRLAVDRGLEVYNLYRALEAQGV